MRRFALLLATALLLVSVTGCGEGGFGWTSTSPEPVSNENMAEQHVSPYGLSGTVTMDEYMSERYTSYDTFAQSFENGEPLPQSLRLYVDGEFDGYVHDPDVIASMWDSLRQIRIDVDHPRSDVSGSYISFGFDSYQELISFPFRTTSYAEFADDAVFSVEDSAKVAALVDELKGIAQKEEAQDKEIRGSELPYENGAWLWDADGDGMREHVWFDFIDNGDEAPSVIQVRVFSQTMDVSGYIDRAYTMERVEEHTDEQGTYLTVVYTTGDYYGHDAEATCEIRVDGDELKVSYPE